MTVFSAPGFMPLAVDRAPFDARMPEAIAEFDRGRAVFLKSSPRDTFPGSPHQATNAIFLRWAPEWSVASIFESLDSVDMPAMPEFPVCLSLVRAIAADIPSNDIGRVMITRLPPGASITEHRDEGRYAEHYQRIHLPLKAPAGCVFTCGGDEYVPEVGVPFWFDHRKSHRVDNRSHEERVHLIVDIAWPDGDWLRDKDGKEL